MRPGLRRRANWVFTDSTAYFALAAEKDANHHAARTSFARLQRERSHSVTTRYILAETHALVVNRLRNPDLALAVILGIEHSASTTIEPVTEADEAAARRLLTQYRDHLFSLTNAISFTVIRRLGIPYAFAFDSDFTEYGVPVLTP